MPANGALVAEVDLGKRFVDHRNGGEPGRSPSSISRPSSDWNLHSGKEFRPDEQNTVAAGGHAGHADRKRSTRREQRTMREAHAADSWDRTESVLQIAVEGGNLRIAVSGLSCVQLKQQQVFAIESQLDGLQVLQRPYEESRRNQDQ